METGTFRCARHPDGPTPTRDYEDHGETHFGHHEVGSRSLLGGPLVAALVVSAGRSRRHHRTVCSACPLSVTRARDFYLHRYLHQQSSRMAWSTTRVLVQVDAQLVQLPCISTLVLHVVLVHDLSYRTSLRRARPLCRHRHPIDFSDFPTLRTTISRAGAGNSPSDR